MDIMAVDMVWAMDMDMAMVTTDIMASVPLSQLPLSLQPLLSLDIFMVMDMVMDTILAMDMVDMDSMDMAMDHGYCQIFSFLKYLLNNNPYIPGPHISQILFVFKEIVDRQKQKKAPNLKNIESTPPY